MVLRNASLLLSVVALGACSGGISKHPPIHPNLDMDFQQKLKAQSEASFAGWTDGRGMRLPVDGTVSRKGHVGDPATLLARYDRDGDGALSPTEAATLAVGGRRFAVGDREGDGLLDAGDLQLLASLYHYKDGTDFVVDNALPATQEVLERGRERFNIHCAVCHGESGAGGIVASRWPNKIPSLVNDVDGPTRDRLVALKHGEIVDVISNGRALMPAYGSQVHIEDRWAIAHYVKALQKHFN